MGALSEAKAQAQERVQRLKYSANNADQQAPSYDQGERKYERQKHKYERLAKVLVSVKAGIQHLSERLEGVAIDEAPLVLADDNMVEGLQQCEKKLRIVMEAIREEEEALVRDMGEAALKKTAELPAEPPVVNNNRVRDADAAEEAASEEEFEEDREALKKQSGNILDKATKKTKKRRKGKSAE